MTSRCLHLLILLLFPMSAPALAGEVPPTGISLSRIPLSFEVNQGQADARFQFLTRGAGYSLYLGPDQVVFALSPSRDNTTRADLLSMSFVAANPDVTMDGSAPVSTRSHYYKGRRPEDWITDIPRFGRVNYRSLYPGIDMVFYGKPGLLEYDLVVQPGASPDPIALDFGQARSVTLDQQGNLQIELASRTVMQRAPVTYQLAASGERQPVDSRYTIGPDNRVGFEVGAYDPSRRLIIDPILLYFGYLGGSIGSDDGRDIATDSDGAAYIAGSTTDTSDFPESEGTTYGGGCSDAFVAKVNRNGSSLEWAIYHGAEDCDEGRSIAVDSSNNVHVVGSTSSSTFPVSSNAFQDNQLGSTDAFYSMFSSDGSTLLYSSYLGGEEDVFQKGGPTTIAYGVGVDGAGDVYVAGATGATDLPTKGTPFDASGPSCCADFQEGFISVFDPDQVTAADTLKYSTYLGSDEGGDAILDLTVVANGVVAVTGWTEQANFGPSLQTAPAGTFGFPVTSDAAQSSPQGLRDAFITRLDTTDSTLGYSSLLGSADSSFSSGEAIDSSGDTLYIVGTSDGTMFPTTNGAHQTSNAGGNDIFLAKVLSTDDETGSLDYATFYGGTSTDRGRGVAVNGSGEAWFVGHSTSTDFTLVSPFDNTSETDGESSDLILGRINSTGSAMLFSSYLGGDEHEDGGGGAVAPNGDFLLTGQTFSTGLGTTGSFQATAVGTGDAIVARIGDNADLALLVATGAGPAGDEAFLAGTQLTYTMTVTNNGPSTSANVVATATLDPDLTAFSATPTAGSCSGTGTGLVTCNLGSMLNAAVVTIPIVIDIDPFSDSSVTSDFEVSADTFDNSLTDNVAQPVTSIDHEADLSITKTDSADPVEQGGAFSYTVTATNNGPSGLHDVRVTDTLPAEVSFVSSTPPTDDEACSLNEGVLSCPFITLGPTETFVLTINVTAGAGPATATNAADVFQDVCVKCNFEPPDSGLRARPRPAGFFGQVPDPNENNNDVMESTTINGLPDLGVSGSDSPDPVLAGNNVTYSMTVENFGTATAPNSVLTATLDTDLTFVSATPGSPTCTESAGTVTCNLGSIAEMGTSNVSIVAAVDPTLPDETALSTFFETSTSGNDSNDSNDDTSIGTLSFVEADLAVTKTDSQDPVIQNTQFDYTLTITNNGPSQSPASFLEDELSAQATLISWDPVGACGPDGNLFCTIPPLAPDEDFVITLTALAGLGPATITNTATLSSSSDNTPGNDQAVETTEIQAQADLSLTKTDSADPADVDQPLTYTLSVTNNGPVGATGVTLVDTLPPETIFLSAAPPAANCTELAKVVTCDLGSIANGATEQVTIQVLLIGAPEVTITNNAQVSAIEPDPDMGNNVVAETTLLDAQADVQVTLSHTPDPLTFPEPISILATVLNNGPSNADSGTVTIALPASLDFVSVVSGFSCSPTVIGVACTFGLLPPSAPVNINIQANTIQSGNAGVTASVSSSIPDPDLTNNSDSDLFIIGSVTDFAVEKTARFDVGASGRSFWYEMTLSNLGSADIPNVTLTDTLDAGQTFSAIDVLEGDAVCMEAGGTVTCSVASLEAGSTVELLLTVTLAEGLSGPFLNEASAVDAGASDTNPENNSSTAAGLAVAPGDINGDGVFDAADIVLLLAEVNDGDGEGVFEAAGGSVQGSPAMDVNGDDAINLDDFDALTALIFE